MNIHKMIALMFGMAIACAISFSSAQSTLAAAPSLLDRVNEALREAGIPVNEHTQQTFAAGVASGHYTSYEQLVNAMKWHKAHGRFTADTSMFAMPQVWKFVGSITEINSKKIEVTGTNANGVEVMPKFNITKDTKIKHGTLLLTASEKTRTAVLDDLRRGSVVTIWYTSSHNALVIENMAPPGMGDYFGPVDCTRCGIDTDFIATPDPIIEEEEQED